MKYGTQLFRDYFISHEIRIPKIKANQLFNGSCHVRVFGRCSAGLDDDVVFSLLELHSGKLT